jgi:hypothetical protein
LKTTVLSLSRKAENVEVYKLYFKKGKGRVLTCTFSLDGRGRILETMYSNEGKRRMF